MKKFNFRFLKVVNFILSYQRFIFLKTGHSRSGFRVENRTSYVLKKRSVFKYTMVTARAPPQNEGKARSCKPYLEN